MARTSSRTRRRDGPSGRSLPGRADAPPPPDARGDSAAAAQPPDSVRDGWARLLIAVLALTLGARVAASFASSNWLWGIDLLRYWPPLGQILLVALAVAGFVPWIGGRVERALEYGGSRWQRAGFAGDAALGLAVAVVLFVVRDPLRFTGDFDLRVGLIGLPEASARRLMSHAYPLDWLAGFHATRALHRLGMDPLSAAHLVGAVTGGLFVLAGSRFLRATGALGASLAAAAVVLLGSGVLVHFAGYNKFGPLLAGIALAAAGVTRLARGEHGVVLLTAGTLGAILSHRSGYLVIPAFVWAWAHAWRGAGGGPPRAQLVAAMALVAAAAIALAGRTADVLLNFDRSMHLPGGAVAASRESVASAGWLPLADAANAAWFLAPLGLAGIAAAWFGGRSPAPRRRRGSFSLVPVAGLALAPFVALVIFVRPGGGWGRDWDVATGMGAVAALATAGALASRWRRGERATLAPASTLALSAAIALWGVHSNEAIGLERVEGLIEARPSWSDATRAQAFDFLGVHALNSGRAAVAARHFERSIEFGPNPRLYHQLGLALLAHGEPDRARVEFLRSATLNPRVADPWLGLARAALAERDTSAALRYIDSTLVRDPRNPEALQTRANLGGGFSVVTPPAL